MVEMYLALNPYPNPVSPTVWEVSQKFICNEELVRAIDLFVEAGPSWTYSWRDVQTLVLTWGKMAKT